MNALMTIIEPNGLDGVGPAVDARELHAFLEIGKDYTTWIRSTIERYGFEEGQDFRVGEILSSPDLGNAKSRPQRMALYAISLDMAKEIAMIQRSWRGRQARKYFIECERRAKGAAAGQGVDLRDPLRIAEVALQLTGIVQQLVAERSEAREVAAELAPKADFYDAYVQADGLYTLQNAARALGHGPAAFVGWLKTWALFYQGTNLVPRAEYVKRGVFEVRTGAVRASSTGRTYLQTLITPKGLAVLALRWARDHSEAA